MRCPVCYEKDYLPRAVEDAELKVPQAKEGKPRWLAERKLRLLRQALASTTPARRVRMLCTNTKAEDRRMSRHLPVLIRNGRMIKERRYRCASCGRVRYTQEYISLDSPGRGLTMKCRKQLAQKMKLTGVEAV